ncbi:hypothetical protein WJX74_007681 [Apatococcus lobatus]|uniref:Uncharacterized protein n=1 Tax=Apatococcus lobatus TaxID=904363 RepID=A0AAW1R011_9CHLO
MATKGSTNQTGYKATYQIVDIAQFIRFSDGSKLSAARDQTQASNAGSNPLDVGQYRAYETGGTLNEYLPPLNMPGDDKIHGFVLGVAFATALLMLGRAMDLELSRLAVAERVVHVVMSGPGGDRPQTPPSSDASASDDLEEGEWVQEGSDLT